MLLTRATRGVVLAAALGAIACEPPAASGMDGSDGEPCPTGFLGDADAAPDFDIQVVLPDYTVASLEDGGSAPMLLPPQGGRVVFVGVRATNLDGCGLQLTGALRDLTTRAVMIDSRTINLVPTGDGWGTSAPTSAPVSGGIASFSNVPVCPNQWSASDLFATAYGLEVTVADRRQRQLTKKIVVYPACAQPENQAQCLCICRAGYVSGQACGDAGIE